MRTITTQVTPSAKILWVAVEGTPVENSVWIGKVANEAPRYRAEFRGFDAEGKAIWRLSWTSPEAGYWNENFRGFASCRRAAAVVERENLRSHSG